MQCSLYFCFLSVCLTWRFMHPVLVLPSLSTLGTFPTHRIKSYMVILSSFRVQYFIFLFLQFLLENIYIYIYIDAFNFIHIIHSKELIFPICYDLLLQFSFLGVTCTSKCDLACCNCDVRRRHPICIQCCEKSWYLCVQKLLKYIILFFL